MSGPWDAILDAITSLADAARSAARGSGSSSTTPSIDFNKGKADLITDFSGALFRTSSGVHHAAGPVPIRKDGSKYAINLVAADGGVKVSKVGWLDDNITDFYPNFFSHAAQPNESKLLFSMQETTIRQEDGLDTSKDEILFVVRVPAA